MISNTQTFKPINQTISEIFSCDAIYKIPNYQRQYSWANDQLDALWNDLYEAYQNKREGNDCYFLGSIVVVNNGRGFHELIDGQQRITTLVILIDVIRKTFPDINENNDNIYSVKLNKLNKYLMFDEERNRLQLQTDPKYDTIFNDRIIKNPSYANCKEPTKREIKQDTPEYKYINTAFYFYNKLKELDKEDLSEFINYIFFNTNIIKIECTNQSFAIKLFQVLNDRGLELSAADLIKSYIIGKYDERDEHEKQVFNNNWKEIEELANRYDFKIDEFIVYYEYFKLKSNPKRQVADELKAIIEIEDVNKIVSELLKFAKSLEKVYQSTDKLIYSLRYIPWKFYVMTALTSAMYVEYPDIEKLFDKMRRFFYISFISGNTLNQIKQVSFKLIEYIVDKKPLEDIELELNKTISNRRMIKKVYDALNDEVYNEKYLKPLLISLDYELRERTNTSNVLIDSSIHMDHILPQSYKGNSDWNYIDDNEASKYMNTLGNMALLLNVKNEEALNRGFNEKIRIYKGQDKEGNNKTGISDFVTTRVLIDEYNRGKTNWDETRIMERQEYLLNQIEEMLDISEEDIENTVADERQEFSTKFKWKYKNDSYNNKSLVRELLGDYFKEKNITSFNDIPNEIRTFKMVYSDLIVTKDNNRVDLDYYYLQTLNGIELYLANANYTSSTKELIEIMKKYFDFEVELKM